MTKDEHAEWIRNVRRIRLFCIIMFIAECVFALMGNDRTWLYIALIPLAAIALGTFIINFDKNQDGEGQ